MLITTLALQVAAPRHWPRSRPSDGRISAFVNARLATIGMPGLLKYVALTWNSHGSGKIANSLMPVAAVHGRLM